MQCFHENSINPMEYSKTNIYIELLISCCDKRHIINENIIYFVDGDMEFGVIQNSNKIIII